MNYIEPEVELCAGVTEHHLLIYLKSPQNLLELATNLIRIPCNAREKKAWMLTYYLLSTAQMETLRTFALSSHRMYLPITEVKFLRTHPQPVITGRSNDEWGNI